VRTLAAAVAVVAVLGCSSRAAAAGNPSPAQEAAKRLSGIHVEEGHPEWIGLEPAVRRTVAADLHLLVTKQVQQLQKLSFQGRTPKPPDTVGALEEEREDLITVWSEALPYLAQLKVGEDSVSVLKWIAVARYLTEAEAMGREFEEDHLLPEDSNSVVRAFAPALLERIIFPLVDPVVRGRGRGDVSAGMKVGR
jgi:hypothetical protein